MPAPYSNDLRQRVIDAYIAKEGSLRQLADRFKVSLSFVQRLIRRYRNIGQVTPKQRCRWSDCPLGSAQRAIAKITVEKLSTVRQLVDEQPDALLEELCERLAKRNGITVSIPTMPKCNSTLRVDH
jgi:transposase